MCCFSLYASYSRGVCIRIFDSAREGPCRKRDVLRGHRVQSKSAILHHCFPRTLDIDYELMHIGVFFGVCAYIRLRIYVSLYCFYCVFWHGIDNTLIRSEWFIFIFTYVSVFLYGFYCVFWHDIDYTLIWSGIFFLSCICLPLFCLDHVSLAWYIWCINTFWIIVLDTLACFCILSRLSTFY